MKASQSQREAFEAALGLAGTEDFLQALRGQSTPEVIGSAYVEDEVYLAAFSTEAGRAVLLDLYTRFVNGPSWTPGEPLENGVYREGGKWVLLDILHRVETAAKGGIYDGQD